MKDEIQIKLDEIRAAHGDTVGLDKIASVVESILSSLNGDITASDLKIYHELDALAGYIRKAKIEIASIRPEEIKDEHIPIATDELDAIVAATEEATGTILDCAENLENIASSLDEKNGEAITEAVTKIYEACNFQDITGQRITKVVKALKHIEEKVCNLVAVLGEQMNLDGLDHGAADENASQNAENSKENLLHGPALPQDAVSQEDIDALLASND